MKNEHLEILSTVVNEVVNSNSFLLVDLKSDNQYNFKVFIDKLQGNVTIDDCVTVSRQIEDKLLEKFENFSLEVSSPGLTSEFKIKGILKSIDEEFITVETKVRKETKNQKINFNYIKRTKLVLKF